MIMQEIRRLLKARSIIYSIIVQELKRSHRDKLLGNLWSFFDPLLMMIVLYIVFHHVRDATYNFSLYLFSGLIVWDYFSRCVGDCSLCLKQKKAVIQKFPLPLAVFPVAICIRRVYELFWGLIAYAAIFLALKLTVSPDLNVMAPIWMLPLWLVTFWCFVLGISLIVARIGVTFADISDVVQIGLRMGFFLTPIFYPMSYIKPDWEVPYFMLNPLSGFIVYFRQMIPGGVNVPYTIPIDYYGLYLFGLSLALLVVGFLIFYQGREHATKYI